MFILIDRATNEEFSQIYDHIDSLDDRDIPYKRDAEDYVINGPEHVVAAISLSDEPERWSSLYLASKGARLYSNHVNETHWAFNSPIYAGPIPEADKLRKISVDASMAESRAGHFASFGVNYIGRTKLNPRNIFVLDNKKGNGLHDPAKDATLEALYGSLPDDWWGSCGFVSSGNPDKLGAFLEEFQGDVIPLAFTTGAFSKLKYLGLDFVEMGVPDGTVAYGVTAREASNRLSYKLSEPEAIEPPAGPSWLTL